MAWTLADDDLGIELSDRNFAGYGLHNEKFHRYFLGDD
jgi:hypothetical protein